MCNTGHRVERTLMAVLLMVLMLAVGTQTTRASALSMPGSGGSGQQEQISDQEMSAALGQLITTLENSDQRSALLQELRHLRDASQARADGESSVEGGGLLGVLAATFGELAGQQGEGRSLLTRWQHGGHEAMVDIASLSDSLDSGVALLRDFTLTLLAQLGLGMLFFALIRSLAWRYGVAMTLPEQPGALTLLRYCLRRVLPTGLALGLVLLGVFRLGASPGMLLATTLGWAALCGMLFASICEVVFSLFSWGHRRVALRRLRQRGAWPLFWIGAVAALGDAFTSSQLRESLGSGLTDFAAGIANLLAVLLTGLFVIRFRRPVRHLIRNRPWAQRREGGAVGELLRVLGGLWHVPALLLVAVSLIAVLTYSGDVRSILARALFTAALMVIALIATGLLKRSARQPPRRSRRSLYVRRLSRFGTVLLHLLCWTLFAQLAALSWGFSLLPLDGDDGLGERIARPLLSIGLTILISWLVWIMVDTAIHRAMTSTSRSQRGRARRARAETITPLLRNVVFVTIFVIGAIAALANLGVNVTPLLAGAGVIGLAIGFGAQTLVQDLITGVFILVEDTLAIDDFVDVGGNMGTVEKLSLRTVRLRDLDGIVHSVPFSQIKSVQNYSREFGYALLRIRVPWNMTIDYAQQMIEEIAEEMRSDPLYRFRIWSPLQMQGVESFTEGAAIVRAQFRTAPVTQWEITREFQLRLKRRMDNEGFELAAPRMSVRLEEYGRSPRGGDDSDGDHALAP
ncbi:mechanosensitive ion channel family protein [Kushneria aurantia]|uniref:Mechanosensitive ion channel family protein n=1 Tax=Kushneria aurantia TaxID=504092 RepID=A0ABV6G5L8_9GAMM|nr:mechanosensitive ion channel family protein [Kushneria aurantia]